jgi:hypothetical protein
MIYRKNINWFNEHYKNTEEKYWAISEYLNQDLRSNTPLPFKEKLKFFDFIREYTIQRTGLDPFKGISN